MIAGQLLPATPPTPVYSGFAAAATYSFTQSGVPGDIHRWDLGPYWRQECLTDTWTDINETVAGLAPCNRCGT